MKKLRIFSLIGLLILSGCVTVTDSRFAKKANPEKAAETYTALGVGYVQAGDLPMGRRKIERALEIDDEYAAAHSAMGLYWHHRGEPGLAQQKFEKALDIDDDHSPSNYHYGRFLLIEKNDKEACEYLAKAANDVDYTARVIAYEDLGICYSRFDQQDKSIAAYERAWSLDSDSTVASLNLSQIYLEKGRPDIATRWFNRFERVIQDNGVQHNATSLYVGAQIGKASGDVNAQASYAFKLRKRFPQSNEYQSYVSGN